jgi:hypothetical protein
MWRSLFLAVGVFVVLLGAQCLVIQKFVLTSQEVVIQETAGLLGAEKTQVTRKKEISPAPWTPWSLMSTGVITCIYSFTIPARVKK